MNIFIFGSMNLKNKTEKIKQILKIIQSKINNFTVITGDCYGIDADTQKACKQLNINCIVYHIGQQPRNNSYNFETKKITGKKFTDKDVKLCIDCDYAIAFWNGTSKGTARNINQLKFLNKKIQIIKLD